MKTIFIDIIFIYQNTSETARFKPQNREKNQRYKMNRLIFINQTNNRERNIIKDEIRCILQSL